ncbi:MAG: hypothetical protein ACREXU_22315 [Gammaproteobacteria bacterium]
MKHLFGFLLFWLCNAVFAANYTVTGSWTDPTPSDPGYTASYNVEHRVNADAVTTIYGLPMPSFSTTVVANATDTIEVRVRAHNLQPSPSGTAGPWSAWFAATAPMVPVTPAAQTGVVITVTPQ